MEQRVIARVFTVCGRTALKGPWFGRPKPSFREMDACFNTTPQRPDDPTGDGRVTRGENSNQSHNLHYNASQPGGCTFHYPVRGVCW